MKTAALFVLAFLLPLMATPAQNFKVSGKAVREDPSNQTSIRLSGGNAASRFLNLGPDGSFEFLNVPAGQYDLMVGPRMTMTPFTVIVTDKDVTGLEVRVPATGSPAPLARGAIRGGVAPAPPLPPPPAPVTPIPPNTNRPSSDLRQITVYDRQGNVVSRLADPVFAAFVSMSSDGKRVAYGQADGVIMVVDLAAKIGTRITTASTGGNSPAWSADGSRLAYRGLSGLYVKASNGTGSADLILPAAQSVFQWSVDGRFILTGVGSTYAALPLSSRQPEVLFSTNGRTGLRLSPDNRYVAYVSNESGTNQVWVRSFNPGAATAPSASITETRITANGAVGMIRWKDDGSELYYLAPDGAVMATPVSTAAEFKAGTPVPLFRAPPNFPLLTGTAGQQADVSGDGQHFVFLAPVAP